MPPLDIAGSGGYKALLDYAQAIVDDIGILTMLTKENDDDETGNETRHDT